MARKGIDRQELVTRLAGHVLAQGLGEASLRPLARSIGTSDRMLLYYFPDKAALLTAVIGDIATTLAETLDRAIPPEPRRSPATLLAELRAIIEDGLLAPYLRVWSQVLVAAEQGQAPFVELAEAIGASFHAWVASRLDTADPARRDALASLLLVLIDGAVLLAPLAGGQHGRAAFAALAEVLGEG